MTLLWSMASIIFLALYMHLNSLTQRLGTQPRRATGFARVGLWFKRNTPGLWRTISSWAWSSDDELREDEVGKYIVALFTGSLLVVYSLFAARPAGIATGLCIAAAPPVWRVRRRALVHGKVLRCLPSIVSFLAIIGESGVGARTGLNILNRIGYDDSGVLPFLCDMVSAERSIGEAFFLAYRKFGEEELLTVAETLSVAERAGAPFAQILMELAGMLRHALRMRKEREMSLLPLKLTLVTIVFLLPSILVIALVPNVLTFINARW